MTEHGSKLAIGALARRSECSIDTIRYYERMDLLPDVPRGSGGHRHYGNEHVRRLRFIRRARQLGLTLAEVRDLVARITRHSNDCRAMRALLKGHAQGVSRKIGELRQLEATLDQLLHACGGCRTSRLPVGRGFADGRRGRPGGSLLLGWDG